MPDFRAAPTGEDFDFHCRTVKDVYDAEAAAEKWAEEDDCCGDYTIVGGEPASVTVQDAEGNFTVWHVSGESVPTYHGTEFDVKYKHTWPCCVRCQRALDLHTSKPVAYCPGFQCPPGDGLIALKQNFLAFPFFPDHFHH